MSSCAFFCLLEAPYPIIPKVRTILTRSLVNSLRDVDLTDMTLAFEDANSKLVEVANVADVDAETHVDDSWCRFGHKSKFFLDFEHKDWLRFFRFEVQAIF